MAQNNKTIIKRLQRFFGIKTATPKGAHQPRPVPARTSSDGKRHDAIDLPSDVQKFYDYWLTNYDNYESLKHRFERYRDLEFCVLNSGIVGFAHELYTDETITPDENGDIIQVNAKNKKVEKYIREFLNRLGIARKNLRSLSDDIALYADGFWALGIDDEVGISEITPLSVYQITDRLEFNATRVESELNRNQAGLTSAANQDARVKAMVHAIQDGAKYKNYNEWYKSYLFGFKMDSGRIIPPWNLIHFRRYDSKSEFAPFGKPLFLKSIARFRQLKAMENLIAMLRAAKMPREVYNVQLDENLPETERWDKLNEAREEYYSFGDLDTGNENEMDIGSPIWTASGLIDFSVKEARVNIDSLGDFDQIKDDLALTTGVPQGYYNPSKSFSGSSGQSLLQQYKPFGRKIYHNQSAILEGLVHLVKLQFAITNDFPVDEEFELTMSFPITEETRDQISNKNDTLRLAKDVIDNIGQAVGIDRDGTLPREVIKDIFSRLTFISDEEIEKWIDAIPEEKEEEENPEEGSGDFMFNSSRKRKAIQEWRKRIHKLPEGTIRAAYFKAKSERGLTEGVSDMRHYLTSHTVDPVHSRVYEYLDPKFSGKLEEEIEMFGSEETHD